MEGTIDKYCRTKIKIPPISNEDQGEINTTSSPSHQSTSDQAITEVSALFYGGEFNSHVCISNQGENI